MAHYAFLNSNNIVTEVIVGRDEHEIVDGIFDWEEHYGNFRSQICKRTSYNTRGGVHQKGGVSFRKNYAGIGYTFDGVGFAAPKPFESWSLNQDTYIWEAPTPMPTEGGPWMWVEADLNWQEISI